MTDIINLLLAGPVLPSGRCSNDQSTIREAIATIRTLRATVADRTASDYRWRANNKALWEALGMIREAVEQLGVGLIVAPEQAMPEPKDEALAIIAGIHKLHEQLTAQLPKTP